MRYKLFAKEKEDINFLIFTHVLDIVRSEFPPTIKTAEILSYLDSIGYDNQDNIHWRKLSEDIKYD